MKTYVQNLALLSAVIAFGCNSNKTEPQTDQENQIKSVAAETDTIDGKNQEEASEMKTIEGIVKRIDNGKDGYTAVIETKNDSTFNATISRANLKDPKQYRSFNINEIVKLNGDYWKMGAENQLTVREIL